MILYIVISKAFPSGEGVTLWVTDEGQAFPLSPRIQLHSIITV